MKNRIEIGNLTCLCCRHSSERIAYILYPMDVLSDWIEPAAKKYDVSIVVITGMDWDDDLTPWPAPGVPDGSPDFKGLAPQFLNTLQTTVVPAIEKHLQIQPAQRDLTGVSLSGLFTLWQWVECDTFMNIASLSGSFWYQGFAEWFDRNLPIGKQGKAYFLLGELEHESDVLQFRCVNEATDNIVENLRNARVKVKFDMVPGNHYQFLLQRIDKAFSNLYLTDGRRTESVSGLDAYT